MFLVAAYIYGGTSLLAGMLKIFALGQVVKGSIALVITAVYLVNYFGRANWARWVMAAGAFFSVVMLSITFFSLDGDTVSKTSVPGLLMLLIIAVDIFLFSILMFSQEINKEFGT